MERALGGMYRFTAGSRMQDRAEVRAEGLTACQGMNNMFMRHDAHVGVSYTFLVASTVQGSGRRPHLRCWVDAEVTEGLDAWLPPAGLVRVLNHKHMITEGLAELKRLQSK